ncbi:Lcl C-terminal domain-containing protein [Falsiroseomonas oryzae]|uniref:Lcl C-terminal domain-containing protein n=1 Tax=Falsiroseomonas oryzae TaxID=2766473 RepID=UPI0022EA7FAA|nr:DUF1566 domain-containing protein [Roseomonas sp. MO-31]
MQFLLLGMALLAALPAAAQPARYPIVATGQDRCFGQREAIPCPPGPGAFFGQDAQHAGRAAVYRDNADGTVADLITGLTWAAAPSAPVAFAEAERLARESRLGGHDDWRVPSIRELHSLLDFRGSFTGNPATSRPYIDTQVFRFAYGGVLRPAEVPEWSATRAAQRIAGDQEAAFAIGFGDGRVVAHPLLDMAGRARGPNQLPVRLVRGPAYGQNAFEPTPTTVRDHATRLEWQRSDDGVVRSWEAALAHCAGLVLGGQRGWRLPHAKELFSIVEHGRVPAISPVFHLADAAAYAWTSTTTLLAPPASRPRAFGSTGELAVYIAFGPALGRVEQPPGSGRFAWQDVHGAGAQRSDPKTAFPGGFPNGFAPHGIEDIRGHNHVRCVRDLTG